MLIVAALVGCDAEQAERTRTEKARKEAQVKHECDVLTGIIDLARQRGRFDLIEADASCATLDTEDCGLKVELMIELANTDHPTLQQELAGIGRYCASEHRFALKYGMEAFRDHRKLVKEAEEYAEEKAEFMDAVARAERDPPERGP
jgi:hypothetical protein